MSPVFLFEWFDQGGGTSRDGRATPTWVRWKNLNTQKIGPQFTTSIDGVSMIPVALCHHRSCKRSLSSRRR